MNKLREVIGYLIYAKDWLWLSLIISTLCDVEMNIRLLMNKSLYEKLERYNPTKEYDIESGIYCGRCPFRAQSKIAEFFYGYQISGFCYLMNNGDYRFNRPTDLLWDGCKECGWFLDENIG